MIPARAAFLVVGWAVLSGGCATTRQEDPVSAVQRYLDLTSSDRAAAAYELLSESFRRRCDLACFTRLSAAQRDDARRALADLRSGGSARTDRTAELTLPDGATLRLRHVVDAAAEPPGHDADPGAYRFSENPLEFYPQSTPEETVRSFVRALAARRYQALLRFVPKAIAEQLGAEQLRQRFEGPASASLKAQIAALQKHWDEPFQVEGTTAKLPTGDGQEVRLVLEQGRWRVAQLQ